MLPIQLQEVRSILCLGAHADDLEIGCGGTLLKMLAARPGQIDVHWVVLSAEGQRADEAAAAAERILKDAATRNIVLKDFRDTFFPYEGGKIKEFFGELAGRVAPDVIFTHRGEDRHQDHRLVWELTWNHFRDHLVLEYELPKYEGDLGQPNLYVPLDEPIARRKVHALTECFPSQHAKHWFSADTFWSLMCLRGLECNAPSKLAEGLTSRKMVM